MRLVVIMAQQKGPPLFPLSRYLLTLQPVPMKWPNHRREGAMSGFDQTKFDGSVQVVVNASEGLFFNYSGTAGILELQM